MFENVNKVDFHEKDYDKMLSVVSKEGETIMVSRDTNTWEYLFNNMSCLQLENPVQAKGNVEVWLGDLLREQQSSLHGVIRFAAIHLSDPSFELHAFLDTAPAQVSQLFCPCINWIYPSLSAFTCKVICGFAKINACYVKVMQSTLRP